MTHSLWLIMLGIFTGVNIHLAKIKYDSQQAALTIFHGFVAGVCFTGAMSIIFSLLKI